MSVGVEAVYAGIGAESHIHTQAFSHSDVVLTVPPKRGHVSHSWLLFCNLQGVTVLYQWCGDSLAKHQVLSGPGGREFATLIRGGKRFVVQANFLTGSPKAPVTALDSVVYRLEGDALVVVDTFPTFGVSVGLEEAERATAAAIQGLERHEGSTVPTQHDRRFMMVGVAKVMRSSIVN